MLRNWFLRSWLASSRPPILGAAALSPALGGGGDGLIRDQLSPNSNRRLGSPLGGQFIVPKGKREPLVCVSSCVDPARRAPSPGLDLPMVLA